jgi:hypothetical protein
LHIKKWVLPPNFCLNEIGAMVKLIMAPIVQFSLGCFLKLETLRSDRKLPTQKSAFSPLSFLHTASNRR